MIITTGIDEGAIEVTSPSRKKKKQSERFVSAEIFKKWRANSDLTLQDLADYMGVTYQSIQKMEKTGLTKTQALSISAIELGVQPLRAFRSYIPQQSQQQGKDDTANGNGSQEDPN